MTTQQPVTGLASQQALIQSQQAAAQAAAPVPTPKTLSFWQGFGEQLATITATLGEEVGLIFLAAFVKKKTGISLNLPQ
jgi:hypothetical protein